MTASHRALLFLYRTAGRDGVSCYDVGGAVWPDRVLRGGRGVSVNGGGDYAAQMLLGRLKSAGLVEHAPSEGSSLWRLSVKGLREVRHLSSEPDGPPPTGQRRTGGARVPSADPCTCGHAPEEHGRDPEYPGSTGCAECDCVAYEADPEAA